MPCLIDKLNLKLCSYITITRLHAHLQNACSRLPPKLGHVSCSETGRMRIQSEIYERWFILNTHERIQVACQGHGRLQEIDLHRLLEPVHFEAIYTIKEFVSNAHWQAVSPVNSLYTRPVSNQAKQSMTYRWYTKTQSEVLHNDSITNHNPIESIVILYDHCAHKASDVITDCKWCCTVHCTFHTTSPPHHP